MGTNYYWRPACDVCGCTHDQPRSEHIGKSSGGWAFSFQATEEIRSAAAWRRVFSDKGIIVNEYGETITPEDFWRMVEAKRPNGHHDTTSDNEAMQAFLDDEDNWFSEREFS